MVVDATYGADGLPADVSDPSSPAQKIT